MKRFTMKAACCLFVLGLALGLSRPCAAQSNGFNTMGDPLTVGAGGTTAMWVTPSTAAPVYGKTAVGVGTAAPQAKLEVNGGLKIGEESCTPAKAGTLIFSSTLKKLFVCTDSGTWAKVPPN